MFLLKNSFRIIFFMILCVLSLQQITFADSQRWVKLYQDARYSHYVDIPSLRYDPSTQRIKVWVKHIDNGAEFEYQKETKCRFEIDLPGKIIRMIDWPGHEKTPSEVDVWREIMPDSYDEHIAKIACQYLNLPPIFNSWVHNWQVVFSTPSYGSTIDFSVCKDYYTLKDNILTVYYKSQSSITGGSIISVKQFNVERETIINGYANTDTPIVPDTFEEALYNAIVSDINTKANK